MPLDDTIRSIAEQNGVQQQFWDIFGKPHNTSPDTNRAILAVLVGLCVLFYVITIVRLTH